MHALRVMQEGYSPPSSCLIIDVIFNTVADAFGFGPNAQRENAATTAFERQSALYGSRYQMQMADMKKAGLNPILSYRQSPPGTGGVAMAPVENLALTGAQTGAHSAAATKSREEATTQKELRRQIAAVAAREEASARNIAQDTRIKQVEEMIRGTRLTQEAIRNRVLSEELHVARSRGTSARATEELYDRAPRLRQLDEILRIIFGRGGPTRD